jgi:hypothetical protein
MNEQQAQSPAHALSLDFCRRALCDRRYFDAPAWSRGCALTKELSKA